MVSQNRAMIRQFEASVTRVAQRLPRELVVPFTKKVALEALARVIAKTPVLSGRARGGWIVSLGAPSSLQTALADTQKRKAPLPIASGDLGPTGPATTSSSYREGLRVLSALEPYVVVWISNNVSYVPILEAGRIEGGGRQTVETVFGPIFGRRQGATGSIQAPQGMLSVTVQELVTIFA